jgi:hypothetical protein
LAEADTFQIVVAGLAGRRREVKLFQIYKEVNGKRVFAGRVAAPTEDEARSALPRVGPAERYAPPVECGDAMEYRSAIDEYEDKIAREQLPDRRGEIRKIINGLRSTLAAMESPDRAEGDRPTRGE